MKLGFILRRIADALDISVETLHGYKIDSSREVLEMLFRMEREYGVMPMKSDGKHTLTVDRKAPHAPKLCRALDVWEEMRGKLDAGEIAQEEYDAWKASFGRSVSVTLPLGRSATSVRLQMGN